MVCLTEASRRLQNLTIDLANQTMDEALEGVSKEEIEIAKQVLYKVYDNLNR